jgi:hypothetical protein
VRLALLQNMQQWDNLVCRPDLHLAHLPSRVVTPALRQDGKGESKKIPTGGFFVSEGQLPLSRA